MHWWSSGRIVPCHGTDPGSILGQCKDRHKQTISSKYDFLDEVYDVEVKMVSLHKP